MAIEINQDLEELNSISKLDTISKKDILNELNKNDKEIELIDSIISDLEYTAAEYLKVGKAVQLPLVGSIRKNKLREYTNKNKNKYSELRKNVTKEEYKKLMSEEINKVKNKIRLEDKEKVYLNRIRKNKKYNNILNTLGKHYAEMYLFAITHFKEVPFDQEVQDMFDYLNNTNNE